MSEREKEIKTMTNTLKALICVPAVLLVIAALFYNPMHVFTAILMFFFGLEGSEQFFKDRDNDIY